MPEKVYPAVTELVEVWMKFLARPLVRWSKLLLIYNIYKPSIHMISHFTISDQGSANSPSFGSSNTVPKGIPLI
jgi:hypothetical protein